jgi:hypothetical protein
MSELQSLSSHISEWRSKQLKLISKQIQQNLRSIQSPLKEKCEKMKKLNCYIEQCGFGAQIEWLTICFLNGYRAKNYVDVQYFLHNYLKESDKKLDQFFLPISETCQPNHLLVHEINLNGSDIVADRKSQLTLLLILSQLI